MHLSHGRMRNAPGALARFHARVDPAFVEKRLGNSRHFRVESA